MISTARPIDTLQAMLATDDPKERIRIYEAANPAAAVERLFGSFVGINAKKGAA